jgi:hypothetical protein
LTTSGVSAGRPAADHRDHRRVALIEDRAQHLLHLLRRPIAGQRLGRALVRADVQEVGGDAEAIEQALQVHRHRRPARRA